MSDGDVDIVLEDLLFDLENPRFDGLPDQRSALKEIIEKQGSKLIRLAEDIVQQGLNPTERVSVIESAISGKYIVVEGNRRLAASKLLCNTARLDDMNVPASVSGKIKKLAKKFDRTIVDPMPCVLFENRDEANHWIELRHTGENKGAGIVPWDGQATARFRGKNVSFQVLDYVRANGNLKQDVIDLLDDFPITNLDRLLGDPDFRNQLGLNREKGKLQSSLSPKQLTRGLKRVVSDIATGEITVSDIKRKEDRKKYLGHIKTDLPDMTKTVSKPYNLTDDSTAQHVSKSTTAANKSTPPSSSRPNLIPKTCTIPIDVPKINDVYRELQRKLNVDQHTNAVAVLSRVFLEMSVTHYMDTHKLKCKDELKPKIDAVREDLKQKGVNANILKAIGLAASQQGAPFSVDLLHAYVHNQYVSPDPKALRKAWDGVQPFFLALWNQIKLSGK